jgi:hypothetical protein
MNSKECEFLTEIKQFKIHVHMKLTCSCNIQESKSVSLDYHVLAMLFFFTFKAFSPTFSTTIMSIIHVFGMQRATALHTAWSLLLRWFLYFFCNIQFISWGNEFWIYIIVRLHPSWDCIVLSNVGIWHCLQIYTW